MARERTVFDTSAIVPIMDTHYTFLKILCRNPIQAHSRATMVFAYIQSDDDLIENAKFPHLNLYRLNTVPKHDWQSIVDHQTKEDWSVQNPASESHSQSTDPVVVSNFRNLPSDPE